MFRGVAGMHALMKKIITVMPTREYLVALSKSSYFSKKMAFSLVTETPVRSSLVSDNA